MPTALPVDESHQQRVRAHLQTLGRWSVVPTAVVTVLDRLLDATSPDDLPRLSDDDLLALVRGRDLADVRLLVAAHAPLLDPATQEAGRD